MSRAIRTEEPDRGRHSQAARRVRGRDDRCPVRRGRENPAAAWPAYDEAAVLRRFDAWLAANTETGPGQAGPLEPRRLERRPRRLVPVRHGSSAPEPTRRSPLPAAAQASAVLSSAEPAWDVSPVISDTRPGGPTVQRLVLGSQLHRLRESRGITAVQAAEAIRGSHSKISRMERGRVGFKERDVADLLTLYGVTDYEERAALLNLARRGQHPGLVARLLRHPGVLARALRRIGGGGLGHPHLPARARPRVAADRGLRPRTDRWWPGQ